jgi:hypothetical protein
MKFIWNADGKAGWYPGVVYRKDYFSPEGLNNVLQGFFIVQNKGVRR